MSSRWGTYTVLVKDGRSTDLSEGSDTAGAIVIRNGASNSPASQPSPAVVDGTLINTTATATAPCHAARLALLCVQNAIRLGARTQLLLCPPGRSRRELQAVLRQQRPRNNNNESGSRRIATNNNDATTGLDQILGAEADSYDDAPDEAVLWSTSTNSYNDESDEDASSGDDDPLLDVSELLGSMEAAPPLDDDDNLPREPLYLSGSAYNNNSNSSMGPGAPGKLPFHRRKLRFFDVVSAQDKAMARTYLNKEYTKSKMRATMVLTRQLRTIQAEAKRRKLTESGVPIPASITTALLEEEDKSINNVEPFPSPMTPAAAAALLLESLALNPLESVEGMAKCYDGIVAVGIALLDGGMDPTKPLLLAAASSEMHLRNRPLRSEIMGALAPLLISSLEQPSGEVILQLAKLRRMSGTRRYQRRFVQRVAPLLIRPPRGALWCLRHQNDMEAILAAAELIFDSAFEVFSKGWYERGRLLLVDKKRAKTLQSAAQQLRDLSNEQQMDGLALGFHGGRRRSSMTMTATVRGDVGGAKESMLAEWEVVAVDRQIRASIGSVMSMDWSRTTVIHADIPKPHNRRATGSSLGSRRVSAILHTPAVPSSPRSPQRSGGVKMTSSPTTVSLRTTPEPIADMPATPILALNSAGRSLSPPSLRLPHSPPSLQRATSQSDTPVSAALSQSPVPSPKSPFHESRVDSVSTQHPALSPKRNLAPHTPVSGFAAIPVPASTTPLSPSSIGTSGSDAYRPVPVAYSSHTAGAPSHYRMLTSTVAERKRTVAACRALRAQIQRFEDAFVQLHGRPPKGASERAPLATTYVQYKEWKRAIRADAACRIQALFRGSSTRWRLLLLNDPKFNKVLLTRMGRIKDHDQILIPLEIDRSLAPHFPTAVSPSRSLPPGPKLPWANKIVRRRSAGDRGESLQAASGASRGYPSSPPAPTMQLTASDTSCTSEFDGLSLPELQAHKRDLKQQLKQYDINFARRHARMPVKAEKEPIRHLYESYNTLKSLITQLETEGHHAPADNAPNRRSPVQGSPPLNALLPPHRLSPTSGSERSDSDDSNVARAGPVLTPRARRKLPVGGSPPMAANRQPPAVVQDLAALKTEKSQLHQMLRSYEKDFFREHNRQVSSFTDIQPVASQYRRYKDIKKSIAALQGDGG